MSDLSIVKNNMGAPTSYTETIAQEICDRIAEGVTLTAVAVEVGVTPKCIHEWRHRHKNFGEAFSRAEAAGFDRIAEKLLTLADDPGDVQRQRLKSDNLKWFLSKRASKVYGDKQTIDVNTTIDVTNVLAEARARRAALRPMSDQQTIEDVENRMVIDSPTDSATDRQSVPIEKAPE